MAGHVYPGSELNVGGARLELGIVRTRRLDVDVDVGAGRHSFGQCGQLHSFFSQKNIQKLTYILPNKNSLISHNIK